MCVVSDAERNAERNHERAVGQITFLHDRRHPRRLGIDFLSVVRVCHGFVTRDGTRTRGFGVERFATIRDFVAVHRPIVVTTVAQGGTVDPYAIGAGSGHAL